MFDDVPENLPVGNASTDQEQASTVQMPESPEPSPATPSDSATTNAVPSEPAIGDPAQAIDPFEGVDTPSIQAPPASTDAATSEQPKRGLGKKVFLVVAIAVGGIVVLAIALLAFNFAKRAFMSVPSKDTSAPVAAPVVEPAPSITPNRDAAVVVPPTITPTPPPAEIPTAPVATQPVVPLDSDGDGLSDADEAGIGTSPRKPDTDNDGLFDREEVETYKTNPLNPDSDGDGYLDGEEVSNGYNPNGSGKLFDIPSS